MTFDELCYTVRRKPDELERWAALGALGNRWREPRDRGKWRHMTKDTAGRVIIMDRLVLAGIDEESAAKIASSYTRKYHWPDDKLRANSEGVIIVVDLAQLSLP